MIDALFNVGNTATVRGIEIELLFTGDRDFVRISTASTTTSTTTCRTLAEAEAALEAEADAAAGSSGPDPADASCGWFDSQAEAQEFFEANPESGPGLDTNGDSTACGVGDWGGVTDCGGLGQELVLPQFCTTAPTTTTSPPPVVVNISGFAYSGATEASVGQAIRFTNMDGAAHTASTSGGTFDTGTITGGQSVEVVIDQPGTYPYFCLFHNGMTGTITVTE